MTSGEWLTSGEEGILMERRITVHLRVLASWWPTTLLERERLYTLKKQKQRKRGQLTACLLSFLGALSMTTIWRVISEILLCRRVSEGQKGNTNS